MARIAIAGFLHETNTFAPVLTTFEDFKRDEGWPGLTIGEEILTKFPGINIGIGGFIKAATAAGHDLLPVCWSGAVPAGYVTEDGYEQSVRLIIDGVKQAVADGADGVYLDLHGAMVAQHHEDGEGELLRRIRGEIGTDLPVVVSLDLHSNTTEAMVEHADAIVAYRTYPHIDMARTGERAAQLMLQLLDASERPAKAFRKLDFIGPITGQCTMVEPSAGVYRYLEELEAADRNVWSISYTPGFHPADIRECGPAVMAYGETQEAADMAADALTSLILEKEAEFDVPLLDPAIAVAEAKGLAETASRPIVLADVQDNCGAGATSDTTGLLKALIDGNATGAVIGALTDPETAQQAHDAGVGAVKEFTIGGKLFTEGDPPLTAEFTVIAVSDGRFYCEGPFYGGTHANLGLCAVLERNGVKVLVSENRMQAADQAIFSHIGVDPKAVPILGLKSSVHFRGDFTPIAEKIINVAAPGAFMDRPAIARFRNLRAGVRLGPKGRPHTPET